jgi:hypothetical protein
MAISFEDAKALLEKGQISSKTFDNLTGIKWDKKAGGGLINTPVDTIVNLAKDTVGGVNDSGQSKEDVTVNQAKPVDAQTKDVRQKSIDQLDKTTKAVEDIGQKTQDVMAPYVEEQAVKINNVQNAIQNDILAQKDQLAEGENQLNQAHQELTVAQQKATIDPDRYMKNLSSGSKVMSAIGIAISGMGAGLTGKSNMAMDVLQRNIDRDIKAQQDTYLNELNIAKQRAATGTQQLQGAQTRAMASSISTIQTLSAYEAGFDNVMRNITSKTAIEKAQMMKNQILEMKQTEMLKYEQLFKTDVSTNFGQTNKFLLDAVRNKVNGRDAMTDTGAKDFTKQFIKTDKPKQAPVVEAEKPAEQPKEEKKPSFIESLTKRVR